MRLMNLSEIMDGAINILRKNVKTLTLFGLGYGIITIIAIIALIFITAIAVGIIAALFKSVWILIVVITAFVILMASVLLSYHVGIIKVSGAEFSGEKIFAHTAIKAALGNIHRSFSLALLCIIALLPIIAVFSAIGYIMFKDYESMNFIYGLFRNREIGSLLLFLIYILVAIFCFIAVLVWFSFSLHVLVLEKQKVLKSVKRSFYLVRKHYWRIFGAVMLFSMTVGVLRISMDILVSLIVGIIYMLLKFLNAGKDFMTIFNVVYSYVSLPLNAIFFMLITPIMTIMLTRLYFNQRFIKEGFDLQLKLKAMAMAIKEEA